MDTTMTCQEASEYFRRAGDRALFESDALRYEGMADLLETLGDMVLPSATYTQYHFLLRRD
jgi:hypothetical protein